MTITSRMATHHTTRKKAVVLPPKINKMPVKMTPTSRIDELEENHADL